MCVDFLLKEYFIDCEVRGLREVTIRGYKNQLNYFCSHYELTQSGVNQFILDSKRKGLHTATINSYLIALRALNNYANLCINIHLLKKDEVVKEIYTDEEVKKLIQKPKTRKFAEFSTWALICFLFSTGCRISTALEIKCEDVDMEGGMIVFRHMKNHTQQYFPISRALKGVLLVYEAIRGSEGYLFCNLHGGKRDLRTTQKQIRDYCHSRGVELSSAHAMRRTFVSNYIRNGGDVYRLQHLIGWKTLDMVNKYARLYATDYAKNIEELNPLDTNLQRCIKMPRL